MKLVVYCSMRALYSTPSFNASAIPRPILVIALPMPLTPATIASAARFALSTSPKIRVLSPVSSISSPRSSTASSKCPASLAASFASSPAPSASSPNSPSASLLAFSSFSSSLSSAPALLSWICQFFVRESFSPNDAAEFSSAALSVSILAFWVSISLVSTWLREASAWVDLSFLSNWEATSFISEPSTRISRLMSVMARLNSRSPSRPILRPNDESAMRIHLPVSGVRSRAG